MTDQLRSSSTAGKLSPAEAERLEAEKLEPGKLASQQLGQHLIADFYGASKLEEPSGVEDVLRRAAQAASASVLRVEAHDFGTRAGFTAFALLAESHISIHTWPEFGYAAIDIFVCGGADPSGPDLDGAIDVLAAHFEPDEIELQRIPRGAPARMRAFGAGPH